MTTTWTFTFGIRLDVADLDGAAPEAAALAGGLAEDAAKSALVPLFDKTTNYVRDIAPRITLTVAFLHLDEQPEPDQSAFYTATVTCADHTFLRGLAQNAADEWEDGDVWQYLITKVEGAPT